jgi:hypothetical protein
VPSTLTSFSDFIKVEQPRGVETGGFRGKEILLFLQPSELRRTGLRKGWQGARRHQGEPGAPCEPRGIVRQGQHRPATLQPSGQDQRAVEESRRAWGRTVGTDPSPSLRPFRGRSRELTAFPVADSSETDPPAGSRQRSVAAESTGYMISEVMSDGMVVMGRVTVNVEPCPSLLLTRIRPPCFATMP